MTSEQREARALRAAFAAATAIRHSGLASVGLLSGTCRGPEAGSSA